MVAPDMRVVGGCAALLLCNFTVLLFGLWLLGADVSHTEWVNWLLVLSVQCLGIGFVYVLLRRALRWQKRRLVRVSGEVKAERMRIAQNLHDGVCAHLFQAQALLDAPQNDYVAIRHSIENAMWALRVEMGMLDDADASLVERLASIRCRVQPLLDMRGIRMMWQMPVQDVDQSPCGNQGVQLAMLAQEAISNSLRHSQCRVLEVRLSLASGSGTLVIADDGCGYFNTRAQVLTEMPALDGGRGMTNMHKRARLAGARMEIIEGELGQGTRIEVSWQSAA